MIYLSSCIFLSRSLRKAVIINDGPVDVARQKRAMAHTSTCRGQPGTSYFASVCCYQGCKFTLRFCCYFIGFLIKLLLFTGYFKFQRIVKTNLISDILILHIMKTTRCTLVREIKEFLIQRMPGCRFSKPCAPLH